MYLNPEGRMGKQSREFPLVFKELRMRFPLIPDHHLLDIYKAHQVDTPVEVLAQAVERAITVSEYLLSKEVTHLKAFEKEWVISKAFQFGTITLPELSYVISQYQATHDPLIMKEQTLLVLREIQKWKIEKKTST